MAVRWPDGSYTGSAPVKKKASTPSEPPEKQSEEPVKGSESTEKKEA